MPLVLFMPAKMKTPGRPRGVTNAFGKWIDQSGKSRETVAERLGVGLQYVHLLCRNGRRPDLELAFKIERMTKGKIQAESWLKIPKHSED